MSTITVTFQNEKARFSVHMKEETAIIMITNTPFLSRTNEFFEEPVCLADEIFKSLGIVPLVSAGALIAVYSFEHWDSLQEPEKRIEWGSSNKESLVAQRSCAYKDAPIEIRKMFYTDYVHKATNPK